MTDREYFSKKMSYIERLAYDKFDVNMFVTKVLFDDIQTGEYSFATIFQTDDDQVYVLHEDRQPITLCEVKRRMKLLGVEVAGLLPPDGDKTYFSRNGQSLFMKTFPGRQYATKEERSFYDSQSIYNPAIMLVSKVSNELGRYSQVIDSWMTMNKISYDKARV